MMISAEQLLDALAKKSLLLPKQVESFRKQLAQPGVSITAAVLAKRLVEKGFLTPEQAQQALNEPSDPKPAPTSEMKRLPHGESHGKTPTRATKIAQDTPLADIQPKVPIVINPVGDSDDLYGLADDEPADTTPLKIEPAQVPAAKGEQPSGAGKPASPKEKARAKDTADSPSSKKTSASAEPSLFKAKKPVKSKVRLNLQLTKRQLSLIGGIGGTVLVVVALVVWVAIRPTGEKELRAAQEAFQAGNFTQAAEAYDEFLNKTPHHAQASQARARRGICRLQQAVKGASPNWAEVARLAAEVIPEIAPEPAIEDLRKDLSQILTAIANGLVNRVRQKPDSPSLAQARQVLEMIVRYVPRSLRDRTTMADSEVTLALVQRQIDREGELGKTIAAIRQAGSQGKAKEVYALRTALVTSYPDLQDQAGLRDAMQAAAQDEKAAVKKVDRKQSPVREESASSVVASITFAARYPQAEAPGVMLQVLVTLVNGTAYGLDATKGKVLWRRFVGLDDVARLTLEPMPAPSEAAGKAVILLDAAHKEVVSIEAATGRLQWRHPLGEEAGARPVVAAGQVFVPMRSGRLFAIDLASGESAGAIEFPQPLRVSPTTDPHRPLIYQVGEQQQLYVVAVPGGQCKQVISLEHTPSTVVAAPTMAGHLLFVVVNDRLMESTLHVLASSADESAPLVPRQQIRLHGHVDTPPYAAGNRMAVATDCGAVYLFEIVEKSADQPLKQIGTSPPAGPEDLVRFPVLSSDRLWVAGQQLTAYQPAPDGSLKASAPMGQPGVFQQPMTVAGKVFFHARRRDGFSGAIVTAMDAAEGKKYWETIVGESLADWRPDTQGHMVTAVTAAGTIFQIDATKTSGAALVDQPQAAVPIEQLATPIAATPRTESGTLMLVGGDQSNQVFLWDPAKPQQAVRGSPLPDTAAAIPLGLGGGLLVAGQSGQISLWDPIKGQSLAAPFVPTLNGGRWSWSTSVAVGDARLVIADNRRQLRLIEWQRDPRKLVELSHAALPANLVSSPVVVSDKVVYAVDSTGTLAAFKLPELQRGATWPLEDGCEWGPWSTGDRVLLASGARKISCLDGEQKLVWQAESTFGRPVGKPCRVGSNFLLAFAGGTVCRIDAASGKDLGKVDVGQSLAAGPMIVGTRLFVGASDGSLLEIKQP